MRREYRRGPARPLIGGRLFDVLRAQNHREKNPPGAYPATLSGHDDPARVAQRQNEGRRARRVHSGA